MRIVLDLQACQTENSPYRGIGRYSLSLAKAIAAQRKNHDLRFALNDTYSDHIPNIKDQFAQLADDGNFSYYKYPLPDKEFGSPEDYRRPIAELLIRQHYAQLRPDVLHISNIFEGLGGKAAVPGQLCTLAGTICSATLYDLIPLVMSDIYLANDTIKKWYFQKLGLLKQCDLLLAISEASRKDAIDYLGILPERIVNISGAANSHFKPADIPPQRAITFLRRYGINGRFVLYTGGIDHRKNIEGTISGYAKLPIATRRQHQLVIVCSVQPHDKMELLEHAAREGLMAGEVVFTGYVPETDLILFYNLCTLFIFPSLYEGFGLPIVEAMASGAPVLGANNSSIPEIIGRQDALFDGKSTEAIAQALQRALTDKAFRDDLKSWSSKQAKLFSWENCAKKALEAFAETYERTRPKNALVVAKHLPRRKMAYFSPIPNQKSGIADYSAELLPELARYYDIDVFTDAVSEDCLAGDFLVFPFNKFEARSNYYDVMLYQLGNSHFHVYMYEMLQRHPGIVVLHDFFISDMLHYISARNPAKKELFAENLEYSHGPEVRQLLDNPKNTETVMLNYPCNRRVLDAATGIIVHSEYPTELLQQFYPYGVSVPFEHIKLLRHKAAPVDDQERQAIRKSIGFHEDDIIVASFGLLADKKLNDIAIAAFCQSQLACDPRTKLVFVGQLNLDHYGKKIKKMIVESGLEEKIIIAGFQEKEQYMRYIKASDFAIQLRAHSRGETSRSVLDCLASGVPVIVNAYATLNDYPDDVVCKISAEATVAEVAAALEQLFKDKALRQKLGNRARAYVEREHNPSLIAAQYVVAIERFTQQFMIQRSSSLSSKLQEILARYTVPAQELELIASCVRANIPDFS